MSWSPLALVAPGVLALMMLIEGYRPASLGGDTRRVATNFLLYGTTFAIGMLTRSKLSAGTQLSIIPWWLALLITLIAFDLSSYLFHRACHSFDFLWRIHRVHHSDHHLDATSSLRHHPAEVLLVAVFGRATVLQTAVPVAAIAIAAMLSEAVGYFSHANIALPERLARALSFIIVTPAVHRVHHLNSRLYANSNYGTVLTLWDRLFGTYCPPLRPGRSEIAVGTTDGGDGYLVDQLLLPLLKSPPRE